MRTFSWVALPIVMALACGQQLYASGNNVGCALQPSVSLDVASGKMVESNQWVCPVTIYKEGRCVRAELKPVSLEETSLALVIP